MQLPNSQPLYMPGVFFFTWIPAQTAQLDNTNYCSYRVIITANRFIFPMKHMHMTTAFT